MMKTVTDETSAAEQVSAATAAGTASKQIDRVPVSTYRIQLRADFNLDDVRELLGYLEDLGISDIYLSPLFRSREESSHGYDVVDHGSIEPTFGGLSAFERLARAVREAGMGILLDVVPNHMGINDPGNVWWLDVLENGEASPYADYFDIDWQPFGSTWQHKLLLPFLGAPFGQVLENGELRIEYVEGRLQLVYGPRRFPLALPTCTFVLDQVAEALQAGGGEQGAGRQGVGEQVFDSRLVAELQDIVSRLRHLPPPSRENAEADRRRRRALRSALRRFDEVLGRSAAVREALEAALGRINGEKGNPRSFDQLEMLLDQQWYRLAYWRVASDEINYRRFFDINELAAIRVEEPGVFDAVHRLVAHFLHEGWITGLRIDHPDGLLDPETYFANLQALYRSQNGAGVEGGKRRIFIAAEKILAADEQLPAEWDVSGTTGYELLNMLSRVMVDPEGLETLRESYSRLAGQHSKPQEVLYESKRTILRQSMASELQMLTAQLYRIAQQHRGSRDFTRPVLQLALREVVASLTVYRTYVRPEGWDVCDVDYRRVVTAVRMAKRRNRTMDFSVFDFIASVLLLEHPPSISPEQAAERRWFALKLQQVSGPVAAKGVEDTAFYRYYPLASLNEVGGELDAEPLSTEQFHRLMRQRLETWPHSMSATSTHDSKRGEDLRGRLCVLSEIPEEWAETFERWHVMNRPHISEVDDDRVPHPNEEYLIYQTVAGSWPLHEMDETEREQYTCRIVGYMAKALREAKVNSSWLNPAEEYESAVFDFVRAILSDRAAAFQVDLSTFVRGIADAGFVNALSGLVLKLTVPGVADFYQGTELWDFSLVDPDNRRPVDFERRRQLLGEVVSAAEENLAACAEGLSRQWPSERIKLLVTCRGLALRQRWPEVFAEGEYVPLHAEGPLAEHVLAFARRLGRHCAIAVVPRLVQRLYGDAAGEETPNPPRADWTGNKLVLPEEYGHAAWSCQLSGRTIAVANSDGAQVLDLSELFRVFPVSLLTPTER